MPKKLLPVLAVAFVLIPLAATTATPAEAQAFTMPTSDVMLHHRLKLPNGTVAAVSRVEGGLITIRELASGIQYGLVARRDLDSSDTATFMVLDTGGIPGSSYAGEHAQFLLAEGKAKNLMTDFGRVQIRLTDIATSEPRTWYIPDGILELEDAEEKLYSIQFQPQCCVACNGFVICADTVTTSCGNCGSSGWSY